MTGIGGQGHGDRAVAEVVEVADLSIDPAWHEVLRDGKPVQLTRLEFQLLYLLAQSANRVVPYTSLIKQAWGYEAENTAESILKTPISRLRTKLGLYAPGAITLQSVAGAGYVLRVAVPCTRPVPRAGRVSAIHGAAAP